MDIKEFIGELKAKAESGDPKALYTLSACYGLGKGVEKDLAKAVELCKKAAEQGDATAQRTLGWCYQNGEGVERNITKAAEWYQKSAEQGDATAQCNLGVFYEVGEGVEKDTVKAVKWYRKSAEQGCMQAQNNLGTCYQRGEGVKQDMEEAMHWFQKAANQGYAVAQYNIALIHYLYMDYEKAVYWFELAANKGFKDAQRSLADCYFMGLGVGQSYQRAAEWYVRAADQGDEKSVDRMQECFCIMAAQGLIDDEYWLKEAAHAGYIEAQFAVAEKQKQSIDKKEKKFSIANSGKRYDAFISWNHKDLKFMTELVKGLEAANFSDKGNNVETAVPHYRNWNEEQQEKYEINIWNSNSDALGEIKSCVNNAIEESKFFILVLSKNSLKSKWVEYELSKALEKVNSGKWTAENIIIIYLDSAFSNTSKLLSKVSFDSVFSDLWDSAAIFAKTSVRAKSANSEVINNVCKLIKRGYEREAVQKYVEQQTENKTTFDFVLYGQPISRNGDEQVNAKLGYGSGYVERTITRESDGVQITAQNLLKNGKSAYIYSEGGSGKSLFLDSLIKNNFGVDSNFFIRVDLSAFADNIDREQNLEHLLTNVINSYAEEDAYKPENAFRYARGQGGNNKMYIVVDGLNEINLEQRKKLKSLISGYLVNYGHDKFIFTARTIDFYKEFDVLFFDGLETYHLSGFDRKEQEALYDNILEANEAFVHGFTEEYGGSKKEEFFKKLENIDSDIKNNPMLLSNLIFLYLRSRGRYFPEKKMEIIEKSVEIFKRNYNIDNTALNKFAYKEYLVDGGIEDILENIAYYRIAEKTDKSIEKLIIEYLQTVKELSPNKANVIGKEIYRYLHERAVINQDKISHDMFTSYFACKFMYPKIYKFDANSDNRYVKLFDASYFEDKCAEGKLFNREDGLCPDVASNLIMKLDYEIRGLNNSDNLDKTNLSFPAFDATMQRAIKQSGFGENARTAIQNLVANKSGFYYNDLIKKYF